MTKQKIYSESLYNSNVHKSEKPKSAKSYLEEKKI